MLKFINSNEYWWQKPLAATTNGNKPAELVILALELLLEEKGVWMNSRGTRSGVSYLVKNSNNKFITEKTALPNYVSKSLKNIYEKSGLKKGCPDLVIWNDKNQSIRFVEVKRLKYDSLKKEQIEFMKSAKKLGIETKISEWDFQ